MLQQANQLPFQLGVIVMFLSPVDHEGRQSIAQMKVHKKSGMIATLCVLTIGSLHIPIQTANGEGISSGNWTKGKVQEMAH